MSPTREDLHDNLADDDSSGWMSHLLAEEDEFDRRTLWRLGSWAAGSVGALVVAILATHSSISFRRDQTAFADLLKQSQQVQWIAKESQDQARRLSAAVETLNGDRDRLYSRVTELEQGLDSVTGSVSRQTASPAPIEWPTISMPPVPVLPALLSGGQTAMPSLAKTGPSHDHKAELKSGSAHELAIAPVATIPASGAPATGKPAASHAAAATELPPSKAAHPTQVASLSNAPSLSTPELAVAKIVEHTEFGVDIGSANSVEGLRALWRGATKTHAADLATLQPIIVVRERHDGFGMRLHLVAGPLADAAAAAKICAVLIEGKRTCETTIFDGQRLDLQSKKPVKTTRRKRQRDKEPMVEPAPEPPPPPKSGLSSILGFRSN